MHACEMVAAMRQARFSRPINWFHVSTFDEIKSQTKDEEEEEDRNLLLCQWYSWRSINKSNRLSQMLIESKGNERARREIKRYEYTITFPVFRQKREEKAKCWRRRRRKKKEERRRNKKRIINANAQASAFHMKTSIGLEKHTE